MSLLKQFTAVMITFCFSNFITLGIKQIPLEMSIHCWNGKAKYP